MKSLSGRAFTVILPVAIVLFGISTWFAYEGAREREIASSMQLLTQDRILAQQALQFRFDQIVLAHQRARKRLLEHRDASEIPGADLDRYFPAFGDGTRRSVDALWSGSRTTLGTVRGMGAFISDEELAPERRKTLQSAFAAMANFVDGLPANVSNIYFFSPDNDLIMYAPDRVDQLSFYRREAPSDLDFQDEEFSRIVAPKANPDAIMRCTSLQPILYDETRRTWTTGCMTPVRSDDTQLGAFGSSLPLEEIFRDGDMVASEGVTRVIVTADGKLIRHPDYTIQYSSDTGQFLDLTETDDPQLGAIWRVIAARRVQGFRGYLRDADIYIDLQRLERPDWFIASFTPGETIRAKALGSSRAILITGLLATALFGLFIVSFVRRNLTGPIEQLAKRADRISAAREIENDGGLSGQDELARLNQAFDELDFRVAQERIRLARSFDYLVDAIEEYAILLLDPSGNVVRANNAARDNFQWVDSLPLSQIMADEPTDLGEILDRVRADGRVSQSVQRARGDGTIFWAFEAIEAIRSEEDDLVGFAYVARDMSGQKEVEAEILAARDTAKAELAARTNLLAVVSHEIRTPLGGVLGIIDQLKRERSPAERERALELVEDSCVVLLDTLDALVQQARIGQQQGEAPQNVFRPGLLAHRVAELFRPLARRKGLRIEVDAPSNAPVIGDPARLQQILSNLVSNAVKFTQSGVVTIYAAAPANGEDDWLFRVTDTGSGMDESRLLGIFDRFGDSRADSLGRSNGAGLGLSITRDLVELLKGQISVQSKPGSGSIFELSLPLKALPEGEEANRVSPSRGAALLCIQSASDRVQADAIATQQGFATREVTADEISTAADGARLLILDAETLEAIPRESIVAFDRVVVLAGEAEAGAAGEDGDEDRQMIRVSRTHLARSLSRLLEEHFDGAA